MIMKYGFLILLLFFKFSIVIGQKITKIYIDFTWEEDNNYLGSSLESDTTRTYIYLNKFYHNDTVKVFINDSLYYNEVIKTIYRAGPTEIIKLPNEGKIDLTINSMPKINLNRIYGKHYYLIEFVRDDEKMYICYMKYRPIIM